MSADQALRHPNAEPSDSLASHLSIGANNLDLVRLVASIAVIFGHSFCLQQRPIGIDPLQSLLKFDYSGSLAVKLFFFLSGLLVCHSIRRDPRPFAFLIKRAFRICPGLFACTAITAFVVGPWLTTLPVGSYLTNPATWNYFIHNVTLYQMQYRLPGVLDGNTYSINGSIWTLPREMYCYIFLAILSAFGGLTNKWAATAIFVTIMALSVLLPETIPRFHDTSDAYYLPALFSLGALFAVHASSIKLNGTIAVLLWALLWLVDERHIQHFIFYIALSYSVLAIACTGPVKRLALPYDASYGVYLYGFLIQQILYHCFPGWPFLAQQLAAIGLAGVAGSLSWFLVEKPAMQIRALWADRLGSVRRRPWHSVARTNELETVPN